MKMKRGWLFYLIEQPLNNAVRGDIIHILGIFEIFQAGETTTMVESLPQLRDPMADSLPQLRDPIKSIRIGGGKSLIYKIENEETKKVYAVKITEDRHLYHYSGTLLTRLAGEENSYTVDVMSLSMVDNKVVMIMEYFPYTLYELIRTSIFPDLLTRFCLLRLCEGLAYMHERMIVHTDLSSDNILAAKNLNIKISDMESCVDLTESKRPLIITKCCHRAPEICQAVGKREDYKYGPEIDIWALGCVFYEMLTKSRPFKNTMRYTDFQEECKQQFYHIHTLLPHVLAKPGLFPADGDKGIDLLTRMLQMRPEKRITAKECLSHPYFDAIKEYVANHK